MKKKSEIITSILQVIPFNTIGRQMLTVVTGKFFGFALAMLTNIAIVRFLGPKEYGIFAIGNSVILLLTGIIGESLDFGVLKYVPKYLNKDKEKAQQIVSSIFKTKINLGL